LSDPTRKLVKAFGVYDPGNDIAWPAVFLIDSDGTVVWRSFLDGYKERPPVKEILDAIDSAKKG